MQGLRLIGDGTGLPEASSSGEHHCPIGRRPGAIRLKALEAFKPAISLERPVLQNLQEAQAPERLSVIGVSSKNSCGLLLNSLLIQPVPIELVLNTDSRKDRIQPSRALGQASG